MAENLKINGIAYNGVKKLSLADDGGNAVYYEKAQELLPAEYPDYVKTEAQRVASEVRSVLTPDSIVSICMSDTHYYGSQGTDASGLQTNEGCLHAAMAAKALTYLLPVDFVAHMGDVSWGAADTVPDVLKTQIEDFVSYFNEGAGTFPIFIAIGNHDPGIYYGADYILDGNYLYENMTAYSESDNTVFSGEANGGYCYRDFEDKKLRVFLLNTSENIVISGTDSGCSAAQQLWAAQALQELNTKSDAAEWGFIVLCHYPMDYGDARAISKVFMQYVNGGSITLNGTTLNFSGANGAKFLCQHHGHVHNFLHDKLHALNNNVMEEYDAWRIGIPNAQYNRENYYGSVYGISFAQDVTYSKKPDTFEDTSFVVNVYNRSEEKIYSFAYGARSSSGEIPNRVVGIGDVTYYSITKALTNVTLSNNAVSIEEGKPYKATLSIESGCELKTVSITMGGSPADEYYSGGVIDIPAVTGNVVITIKAQAKANFTNLVPLAVDSSGVSAPYSDGTALSNSASEITSGYSGFTTTGYIATKGGYRTIRLAGDGIYFDRYGCVIAFYDASFNYLSVATYAQVGSSEYWGEVVEEDNTALTWNIKSPVSGNMINAKYIRVSVVGKGENLIVTEDEEITYGGTTEIVRFVTQNLTNVTSSNEAASVAEGSSFETTLAGVTGYELSSVIVTMGGTDVTSTAYSNGVVSISGVTGDIVITAVATAKTYSVTNTLSNVTSNNSASSISHGSSYSATLSVASGYKMSSVVVKMGGSDITSTAYDSSTGKISISSVTGAIVVTATAIAATYAVTYNLTEVTSSNTSTAVSGSGYSTTLTANDGFKMESVTVTMGGADITSSAVAGGDNENTLISIGTVTGDIVITAIAEEPYTNWIPKSLATRGGTEIYGGDYNGDGVADGYKTGTRCNSSYTEVSASNMCVTGFIPITKGDVIRIKNVTIAGGSSSYLLYFTDTGIGMSVQQSAMTSATVDGVTTITVASNNTATYFRLSVGVIDETSIITINEEIVE